MLKSSHLFKGIFQLYNQETPIDHVFYLLREQALHIRSTCFLIFQGFFQNSYNTNRDLQMFNFILHYKNSRIHAC